MFRYLKIALFATVALIASGLWSSIDTQAFAVAIHNQSETGLTIDCAGHNESQRQLIENSIHPDEAARINKRYHERLAALFTFSSLSAYSAAKPAALFDEDIIYGIAYSSKCLSTCYEYIFRLCPF